MNGWREKHTRWYEKEIDECREDSEEGENMQVVKWCYPYDYILSALTRDRKVIRYCNTS